MTLTIDSLNDVLTEHEQAISSIEAFMAEHAKRAAAAPDPLVLQAALNRIKDQTHRLTDILMKFPVVK